MERNSAYEKLIGDIQKKLTSLEKEIDSVPDFLNPKDMFDILLKNNFNPLQIISLFDEKIRDLSNQIDKLRSKVENGIDYYTRATKKSSLLTETDQEIINYLGEPGYLSRFIAVSTDIEFLDEKLRKKNFYRFIENIKGNS